MHIAGTDVLEGDPLGRFNISAAGIQQRDQMVFEHALHTAKAPIVMTLSGGNQHPLQRGVVRHCEEAFACIVGGDAAVTFTKCAFQARGRAMAMLLSFL
eukprot:1143452-Pelagomonas_calceolata.AAC.2